MAVVHGTKTPRAIIPSVRGQRRLYCERCGIDLAESSRPGTRICRDCQGDALFAPKKKGAR